MKTLIAFAAVLFATSAKAAPEKPVEVMVLGTYHFSNPGLDINNMQADSVLTPKRQAELDALARALLAFRPTKVMLEQQTGTSDPNLPGYRRFTPDTLKTSDNEIVQIGYRIAHMAGLTEVQGIDEQPSSEEPDYFPFDKLQEGATRFGQQAMIDGASAQIKARIKAFEAAQKHKSIAELLAMQNEAGMIADDMHFYYAVLDIGDREAQPGADLNAMWYLRNAKIFGKLMHTAKAGDRVLVVYGAGHNYWLRHFASTVPGYRFVDPLPYLRRTKRVR